MNKAFGFVFGAKHLFFYYAVTRNVIMKEIILFAGYTGATLSRLSCTSSDSNDSLTNH